MKSHIPFLPILPLVSSLSIPALLPLGPVNPSGVISPQPPQPKPHLPIAPYTAPITGKVPRPPAFQKRYEEIKKNKRWLGNADEVEGAEKRKRKKDGKTVALIGAGGDVEYLFNITVGTPPQNLQAIADTGSSDAWLIPPPTSFQCLSPTSTGKYVNVSSSTCAFGPGFNTQLSNTWSSLSSQNLNVTYDSGFLLVGPVGTDTLSIGGLKVTGQTLGSPSEAYWLGDSLSSGIIGLGYPRLTSVYSGTNPTLDSPSTLLPYNPFFFTAISESKVSSPYFSVALNRGSFEAQLSANEDEPLGYISFGGIAPVNVTGTSVTVNNVQWNLKSGGTAYLWYTVDATFSFSGSENIAAGENPAFVILDTGTTFNYVPNSVASVYASSFSPPATFSNDFGLYLVDCNATVATMTVTIGGVGFTIDGSDQVIPFSDGEGGYFCVVGTQPGGTVAGGDRFVLGDTFLHNVVLTANVNSNQITLTERAPYQPDD